jgi:hypothetical protein
LYELALPQDTDILILNIDTTREQTGGWFVQPSPHANKESDHKTYDTFLERTTHVENTLALPGFLTLTNFLPQVIDT